MAAWPSTARVYCADEVHTLQIHLLIPEGDLIAPVLLMLKALVPGAESKFGIIIPYHYQHEIKIF